MKDKVDFNSGDKNEGCTVREEHRSKGTREDRTVGEVVGFAENLV